MVKPDARPVSRVSWLEFGMARFKTFEGAGVTILALQIGHGRKIMIAAVMLLVAMGTGQFTMLVDRRGKKSRRSATATAGRMQRGDGQFFQLVLRKVVYQQGLIGVEGVFMAIEAFPVLGFSNMVASGYRIDHPGNWVGRTGGMAGSTAVTTALAAELLGMLRR